MVDLNNIGKQCSGGFRIRLILKPDTPKDVIEMLDFLTGTYPFCPPVPNHRFFKDQGFPTILTSGTRFFEFEVDNDDVPFDEGVTKQSQMTYLDHEGSRYLSCFGSQRGDVWTMIYDFIDWIHPWVDLAKMPHKCVALVLDDRPIRADSHLRARGVELTTYEPVLTNMIVVTGGGIFEQIHGKISAHANLIGDIVDSAFTLISGGKIIEETK